MNSSELAASMLKWEKDRRELDILEADIKAAVLRLGGTQTVGSVRASYSRGRKSYDYVAVYNDVISTGSADDVVKLQALRIEHSATKTNWRAVCKSAGIDDVPFTQGDPSVSLKLID